MGSAREIEEVLREQLSSEAAAYETRLADEVQSALTLLSGAVDRLVQHRQMHSTVLHENPRIDYLLADQSLRSFEQLMKI